MKSAFRCLAVLLLALSGWLQPCVIGAQQPSPQRADEPKAQTVYVTRTGKRYHRDGCRYLSMSKIRMTLKDMVDAAIAGFDHSELITIPSLPDIADWEAYEAARQNIIPKLSLSTAAARYAIYRQSTWVDSSSTGDLRRFGALLTPGGQKSSGPRAHRSH